MTKKGYSLHEVGNTVHNIPEGFSQFAEEIFSGDCHVELRGHYQQFEEFV